MRPKIAGAALAGIGVVIATAVVCMRSPDSDAPRRSAHDSGATRGGADEGGARVARVEAELAGLRAAQRETAGLVRSMRAPAGEPAPEPPRYEPEVDEAHGQAEARMVAQAELLRDAFEHEAADPRWARSAAERIRERYGSAEFAGVKVDADCKTSLCRIEFGFPPGAQLRNGASLIAVKAPWTSPGFVRLDLDTSRATFYVAREDHELPRIPEYASTPRGQAR